MSDDEGFLQAIRESPDDDVPRLVYADWLMDHGDPRGEFIRLQVERSRVPRDDPRVLEWLRREVELFCEHGDRWLGPLCNFLDTRNPELRARGAVEQWYHRGFVARLTLNAGAFVAQASELTRATVLRVLRLHEAGNHAAALAQCPLLSTVAALHFIDYHRSPLDAEGMRHLAESPHLGRLEVLDLHRNNLGDAGITALASAFWLPNLRTLNLTDNGLSPDGLRSLIGERLLPRLTSLILGTNGMGDEGAETVAASTSLPELRMLVLDRCQLGPDGLDAVLSSANLRDLVELSLAWNAFGTFWSSIPNSLGELRELEVLDLSDCGLTDRGLERLLWQLPQRRLRSVNLSGNMITDRGLEMLCRSSLPTQLTLDLSNNRISRQGRRLLQGPPGSPRFSFVQLDGNPEIVE